jgi:hypothetical protein
MSSLPVRRRVWSNVEAIPDNWASEPVSGAMVVPR